MSKHPVIARPLAERWRDLRLRFVPVLVYVSCIAAVLYLWNTHWMPGTFLGEVQSTVSNVASPLDGQLVELTVKQFDSVTNGQVIGKVTMSPAAANAGLAAIRTELQVMRARMTMDGQRIDQSYEQLRVDLLNQKVDLSIAKSKLTFAENELKRVDLLRKDKISSQYEYDLALSNRDAAKGEVTERTGLITETEETLKAMKTRAGGNDSRLVPETIDAAITAQEEQFRQLSQSILISPINGVVTRLFRQQGENVALGEPLVTISGEKPENIIGFIRQPVSFDPKPGDIVVVRSRRGNTRPAGEARIVKVGARVDLLVQMENETGFDPLRERGLPVLINLPVDLTLYPGELVDITIKN